MIIQGILKEISCGIVKLIPYAFIPSFTLFKLHRKISRAFKAHQIGVLWNDIKI